MKNGIWETFSIVKMSARPLLHVALFILKVSLLVQTFLKIRNDCSSVQNFDVGSNTGFVMFGNNWKTLNSKVWVYDLKSSQIHYGETVKITKLWIPIYELQIKNLFWKSKKFSEICILAKCPYKLFPIQFPTRNFSKIVTITKKHRVHWST